MRRSWFPVLIVACIVGLLFVLAGLQYNWQMQASEADREKMQKRVEDDTARFAEDFNREIQSAYFNFQTDASTWKTADYTAFNERYDYWRTNAAYPELVKEFYFLENRPDAEPLRYNAATRKFDKADHAQAVTEIKARLSDEKRASSVYADLYALALPIHPEARDFERIILRTRTPELRTRTPESVKMRMPERSGTLILILDEDVIKNRLLPDLVQKYYPGGDYRVSVTGSGEQPVFATQNGATGGDASALLFDLSPDNFVFFAKRDLIAGSEPGRGGGVIHNQRVESRTLTHTEAGVSETNRFELEVAGPGDPKPRTAVITAKAHDDLWKLNVQHAAGSVDQFIRSERNKSFAIGLGIYALLIAGILAIVLSAMRSKRFAQRQIDFVSSVSHEFRTPLAVIYSAGENLADGVAKGEDQVERYGNLIKSEGRKLSAMVEQILDFAGARSGRRKYSFAETNVTDIMESAIEECRNLAEEKGIEVETDIPDTLPSINVDRAALSQAIQNLVANAVKYGNGEKWVRVSAANGGGSVKITVEDRGIGISKSELKQIFEPFYRSKQVVDAQIHGNGLGLSLVKQIVEAHGGTISAESEFGKGSIFTIRLPLN